MFFRHFHKQVYNSVDKQGDICKPVYHPLVHILRNLDIQWSCRYLFKEKFENKDSKNIFDFYLIVRCFLQQINQQQFNSLHSPAYATVTSFLSVQEVLRMTHSFAYVVPSLPQTGL